MKFIDEKGRLFGKINLIDFLVILFLLLLIPMFYLAYRLSHKPKTSVIEVPKEIVFLDCYCRFYGLEQKTASLITLGDQDIEQGKVKAEILAMSKPESAVYDIDFGGGQTIYYKDKERMQIFAKVRLLGEKKENSFYYEREKITLGSKILFKTPNYQIEGEIESAEGIVGDIAKFKLNKPISSSRLEPVELNLTLKPLTSDKVNLVCLGDTFLDDNNTKSGEILDLDQPQAYSYKVDLGGGNIISRQDPNRKQILIKARLLGEIKDNAFYYQGQKVVIGSQILLRTDKYSTEGLIESEPTLPHLEPVELSLTLKPLTTNKVNLICLGDSFLDDNNVKIGEILNLGQPQPYSYNVDLGGGNIISLQNGNRRQLLIKARLLGEVKDNIFYYQGQKITIGSQILLRTDKYSTEGLIESEPKLVLQKKVLLKVKFKNLMPELINLIKVGDTEEDAKRNLICNVKSIISNTSSKVLIQDGSRLKVVNHPLDRDIILLIEAMCVVNNDRLFLKGAVIKVGSSMIFSTDNYEISGIIIDINKQ